MSEIRAAQERHAKIMELIEKRETEIEDLREEAEKLNTFLSLAKELFGESAPAPLPDAADPRVPPTPKVQAESPTPPAQPAAAPQPQAAPHAMPADGPRVMPARQPRAT